MLVRRRFALLSLLIEWFAENVGCDALQILFLWLVFWSILSIIPTYAPREKKKKEKKPSPRSVWRPADCMRGNYPSLQMN